MNKVYEIVTDRILEEMENGIGISLYGIPSK